MSLLMGLGKGLQGAGQAIGQGLYAYAMAMRDDERERMREASIEKRYAREDARYDKAQAKDDSRYQDQQTRDDARRKEDVDYRTQESNLANAREGRNDEKQNALLIGQALDRLKEDYKESLDAVDANHLDPLTKQPINPEAYAAKVAEAKANMEAKRANIVQRSGLSGDQINKYGFSMYLPEATTPEPIATVADTAVEPAATAPSFDVSGWANTARQPQSAKSTAMPKPGETKREIVVDYLLNDRGDTTRKPGLLSPETIAQQQEYLKRMRESGVQSAYGAAMMPR